MAELDPHADTHVCSDVPLELLPWIASYWSSCSSIYRVLRLCAVFGVSSRLVRFLALSRAASCVTLNTVARPAQSRSRCLGPTAAALPLFVTGARDAAEDAAVVRPLRARAASGSIISSSVFVCFWGLAQCRLPLSCFGGCVCTSFVGMWSPPTLHCATSGSLQTAMLFVLSIAVGRSDGRNECVPAPGHRR